MNILMIYPKFPEESFWNSIRSAQSFMHRNGEMPPLGLLNRMLVVKGEIVPDLDDSEVEPRTAIGSTATGAIFISSWWMDASPFTVKAPPLPSWQSCSGNRGLSRP